MTNETPQQTQVAEVEQRSALAPFAGAAMPTALALYLNDALFERCSQIAQRLSKAQGVTPKHLIGQPEACFAVVSRAITWRLDPFAVAGATYSTPGGQIGFEGKLVLAILESSGRLEAGGVKFEHYGDWSKVQGKFEMRASKSDASKFYAAATWTDDHARAGKPDDRERYPFAQSCGVRVSALVRGEREPRHMDFDLIQAQPRNSTLWATDPKTQICYTAARRFANAVVPALMMGVPFDPVDNFGATIDVTPSRDDPNVITMPTSRGAKAAETVDKQPAGEVIDKQTGEVTSTATAETPAQPAQNDAQATQTTVDAGTDQPAGTDAPAGDLLGGNVKADGGMKTKASAAQRKMIADMAARKGYSVAQLDEKIIDRYAFGLDEMPAIMVNDVSVLVTNLPTLAPAKRA